MPRRLITSEICFNEKFASLPDSGRLLFVGIIINADDDGRMKASPTYLKAHIFPYDTNKTIDQIKEWRDLCHQQGLIKLYNVNGGEYLALPGWLEHQKIRKDTYRASKLPTPPLQTCNDTVTTPLQECAKDVTPPSLQYNISKDNLINISKEGRKNSLTPLGKALQEVWEGLNKRRNYASPNKGKEASAIKWMVANGFTSAQILATYDEMKKDPFWAKIPHLDMQSVKKQIGAIVKNGKDRGHLTREEKGRAIRESIGKPLR